MLLLSMVLFAAYASKWYFSTYRPPDSLQLVIGPRAADRRYGTLCSPSGALSASERPIGVQLGSPFHPSPSCGQLIITKILFKKNMILQSNPSSGMVYKAPHRLAMLELYLRMKTVELGRKTPQPFSTFTFEIRKRKRTSRTRKRTRTYGISRILETNQFERNYVEHGRYAKIQYEILTHSA